MNASVAELTAAIASGDGEAFTHLFRTRFDEMYAEARRATGRDESFCLDVVQDAMIRVIRSIKPMDTPQRLRNWLRVVVQTCAYDRLRSEARRDQRERRAAGVEAAGMEEAPCGEELRWLRREISSQDDAHMGLLIMRYRLGWTLQRIGEVVGLGPGAVDGRLRRLTALLRRRAKETFHD
ncbi:MAG: RNA polymerase sigma factor [Phycisphaerae bacterium]